MTTSHLYCIFNANDPTPTAIAIRSLNFQFATVYVIGHDDFSEAQLKNLSLLERWITGSAKEGHWPEGLWDSDWDWPEVQAQVTIRFINEINSKIFGEVQADHFFIDLKGGTKAMSIELMDSANEALNSPEFIFSNLGESLLLSKGIVLPKDVLSLSELTYLASGYVMNPSFVPLPEDALAIQNHFSFTQERNFDYRTKRKSQRARFSEDFFKSIGKEIPEGKNPRNLMEQNFLEDFATSMLSLSEEVVEAVGGVRFVDPSFKKSKGTAIWLLKKPGIKDKLEKGNLHEPCMDLLASSQNEDSSFEKSHLMFPSSSHVTLMAWPNGGRLQWLEQLRVFRLKIGKKYLAIRTIRSYLHIMEIDALAVLSSGELIGVECKYGSYDEEDVHRIRSICRRLSPRTIPALVHSKLTSSNPYGVAELSFTEMSKAMELIRLLNSKTLLITPAKGKKVNVPPTINQKDKSKDFSDNQLAPIIKERNALHCLPLIEIAVVSISSSGGNYSTFKRGMKRLLISMENMDVALAELGQKMGFETTNKKDSNWIKWNIEPHDESNSTDDVADNSKDINSTSEEKV